MGGVRQFLSAYQASFIVVLTPLILLPLLFLDELSSMSREDLCALYKQGDEDCNHTIARLELPGQGPTLFRVSLSFNESFIERFFDVYDSHSC